MPIHPDSVRGAQASNSVAPGGPGPQLIYSEGHHMSVSSKLAAALSDLDTMAEEAGVPRCPCYGVVPRCPCYEAAPGRPGHETGERAA